MVTDLRDNIGYNPVGASVVDTSAWSSPQTYTAGFSPEVLTITGGTVSSIAKGATTLGFTAGSVPLEPGESVVITYTVLPTVVVDKR